MNDKEKRVLDMFRRTRGYGSEHATLTTEGSLSHDLFNTIDSVINELEEHSTVEWEGRGTARQGTVSKAVARAAILEDLGILRRTARTMDSIEPGLEEKFRVPYNGSDEELLIAARAALNAAGPYKAEFLRREVREQLFEDLEANIAAFEEALAGQHTGKGASRA